MASIIVVFPKAEDAKNIRSLLSRYGYHVAAVCTSGARALQAADDIGEGMIVCGFRFTDMTCMALKECLPPDFEMLLIASQQAAAVCHEKNIEYLATPLKLHELLGAVEQIQARQEQNRRKQRKPKMRTEKERRMIAEAKQLLMQRRAMTEEEAHRYMQKCSMDSGTGLVETAEMVFALIKSEDER